MALTINRLQAPGPYPIFPLKALADDGVRDAFFDVLKWAIDVFSRALTADRSED